MSKIYCHKCQYFDYIYRKYRGYKRICIHPENCLYKDTYFDHEIIKYKQEPSKINKNNNCKWYEEE